MKKLFLAFVMLIAVSGIANASIYNTICSSSSNTIYFNHSGVYNHGWV